MGGIEIASCLCILAFPPQQFSLGGEGSATRETQVVRDPMCWVFHSF